MSNKGRLGMITALALAGASPCIGNPTHTTKGPVVENMTVQRAGNVEPVSNPIPATAIQQEVVRGSTSAQKLVARSGRFEAGNSSIKAPLNLGSERAGYASPAGTTKIIRGKAARVADVMDDTENDVLIVNNKNQGRIRRFGNERIDRYLMILNSVGVNLFAEYGDSQKSYEFSGELTVVRPEYVDMKEAVLAYCKKLQSNGYVEKDYRLSRDRGISRKQKEVNRRIVEIEEESLRFIGEVSHDEAARESERAAEYLAYANDLGYELPHRDPVVGNEEESDDEKRFFRVAATGRIFDVDKF
jgi:hypothetical protein